MSPRLCHLTTLVLGTTLAFATAGCTPEPAGDQADPHMVILTSVDGSRSPVLEELQNRFTTSSWTPGDRKALGALIKGADLIAMDMSALEQGDVDRLGPLFDEAEALSVPMVMENVDSAGKMTAAIGFGQAAELAYIVPRPELPGFSIKYYGRVHEPSGGEHASLPDSARSLDGSSGDASLNPRRAADDIAELFARGDTDAPKQIGPHGRMKSSTSDLPIGSYYVYFIDYPSVTWYPDGESQAAQMDLDLTVELLEASEQNSKYVVVTQAGSGFNPGSFLHDGVANRGFYQEYVQLKLQPNGVQMQPFAHEPHTTNGSGSFHTTTGYSLTVSASGETDGSDGKVGASASFTYSSSTRASQTLSDFSVQDLSAGDVTEWRWRMSAAEGNPYEDVSDIFYSDILAAWVRSPPALARSNLSPQFEAIYRVDDDVTAVGEIAYTVTHKMIHAWSVSWLRYHTADEKTYFGKVYIDFNRVNPYVDGTVAFLEDFRETENDDPAGRWLEVNEGTNDSASWQIDGGGRVVFSGNSHSAGTWGSPPVDIRGAYLWAPETAFHSGTLTVSCDGRQDDDAFGIMYGIQDLSNYYRFVVDEQRDYARLVKVEDGVFSIVAEDLAPAVNLRPNQIEIRRAGDQHQIYVDNQLVFTGYDNTFYSGSVALFTWEMSRTDWVSVDIATL